MLPPLPIYLIIFFIVFLVVILSLFSVTILLHISLYRYLTDLSNKIQRLIKKQAPGKQLRIIQTLEERFKVASQQLEQVNTTALIDQVYSQEKINGKGFTCEQIDYWCRIAPNLLLAFGLFGTFLGITINLSTLSQTINQTNPTDINNLVAELKKPLEGMSIAFITSLIGLFFSALLTVFNFIFNSGLAKYRLLSSLEDYLDNIYFPQVQGDTRLDKIVNRMVSQQDEFLTNFGKVVREAVEKSMGKVAKQIADGNKETTDLARQVYEKFDAAAGTISGAADDFENSMTELKKTSQVFKDSANIFNESQFPQQLSVATEHLSNTQQKFSNSAASLAETTDLIINLLAQMNNLSNNLINLGEDIKGVNQTSIEVLGLHQTNQVHLSEIIPQLQQGANSLAEAINKLEQVEVKVSDKADSLSHVDVSLNQLLEFVKYNAELLKHNTEQMNLGFDSLGDRVSSNFVSNLSQQAVTLNQLLESVQQNTAQMNLAFNSLGDRFISHLSQNLDHNEQQFQTLIKTFEGYTNQLILKFEIIKVDVINLLEKNHLQLNSEYQQVNNNILQGINNQTKINKQSLEVIIKNIQECNKRLLETKNSVNQLRQVMKTPES